MAIWQESYMHISQLTIANNENPLKKVEHIDKPLTIRQDQESKQVVNTIRETLPEMYTPTHMLILPQDYSENISQNNRKLMHY